MERIEEGNSGWATGIWAETRCPSVSEKAPNQVGKDQSKNKWTILSRLLKFFVYLEASFPLVETIYKEFKWFTKIINLPKTALKCSTLFEHFNLQKKARYFVLSKKTSIYGHF